MQNLPKQCIYRIISQKGQCMTLLTVWQMNKNHKCCQAPSLPPPTLPTLSPSQFSSWTNTGLRPFTEGWSRLDAQPTAKVATPFLHWLSGSGLLLSEITLTFYFTHSATCSPALPGVVTPDILSNLLTSFLCSLCYPLWLH